MQIEKIIGERVRDAREASGLTQVQLGQKLGDLLGKPWSRQAVSSAEQGGRLWTAAELIAVAHVLETTVTRLLTPSAFVQKIELPSGALLDRSRLTAVAYPPVSEAASFEQLRTQLRNLAHALATMQKHQGAALAALDLANQAVDNAEQVSALVAELGPTLVASMEYASDKESDDGR
ncbi:helix-turn-helix domain-containing protein [Crossiella sp. CA198]|uniref:helix-turn-helix domain-containing protein n=1 Tax=Crossiella sp. CA198 TaxID=3455607 RepID=UPI003F8D7075